MQIKTGRNAPLVFFEPYSAFIAFTGHIAAQVPHETHFAGSILHLPSVSTLIAPIGQTLAQV